MCFVFASLTSLMLPVSFVQTICTWFVLMQIALVLSIGKSIFCYSKLVATRFSSVNISTNFPVLENMSLFNS